MRSTLTSRPSATTRATMPTTAQPEGSSPLANCTLIARKAATTVEQHGPGSGTVVLTWAFVLERVTRIELALSAWESVPSGPVTWPDLRDGLSTSDRERPLITGVNGPLMARPSSPKADASEPRARSNAAGCYALTRCQS